MKRRDFIKLLVDSLMYISITGGELEQKIQVPVLSYHKINHKNKDIYTLTPEEFRFDLEILLDNGYQPVRMDELVDGKMKISNGTKPLIITFDDAWPGQFKFERDYKPDRNSAVGIIESICKKYGCEPHGIFFVSFDKGKAFGDKKLEPAKMKYLIDNGFEIGNHTYSHKWLDEMTPKEIAKDIEMADERFYRDLGNDTKYVRFFCYPGGRIPKTKEGMKIIKERFDAAVITRRHRVELSPYPVPDEFLYEIPRIPMHKGRDDIMLVKIIRNEVDSIHHVIPYSLRE